MLVSMINMNMQKIFFLKNSNITGKSEFPNNTIDNNPLCLKQNQWRKALTKSGITTQIYVDLTSIS